FYSPDGGLSMEDVGDPTFIGAFLSKIVSGRWLTPVGEVTGSSTKFILGYRPVVRVTRTGANVFSYADIGHPSSGETISGKTFLKTARGNASRIYAGDNDVLESSATRTREVYTSTDGGVSWDLIYEETNGIPFTDLAFDSDNGNRIWLTFGGYSASTKVKYSSDGGANWNDFTGSLPNVPVNCIVFDDNNGSPGGAVYIGTDIGVFYRDNNLNDWIPFSNGLPVVEITDLEIHETAGLLRAGTYGRGIWETSLYSNCPATTDLTTANTQSFKPYYFQASQNIGSSAVHTGTGAFVFYKAGIESILSPGFIATAAVDNEFRAFIGPCGGGVPSLLQPSKPVIPLKGFLMR
ncbi:MAG TPA: hypothetical protein VK498_14125, partial [Ferruginibacter sp.]|nr:hypothetical protein [Ferruginibacter sp.]